MAKGVLLDAGAQLEKVIMRRCIELGHEIRKLPFDVSADKLVDADFIIGSGGPRSVNDPDALLIDPEVYRLGKPMFHICYSMQAVAHQLGGRVEKGERGQYGRNYITVKKREGPFIGLSEQERILMSHFDTVVKVPPGFEVYATSEGMIAAIGNKEKRIYAVQFHPELIPVTKHGDRMFDNFFRHVCGFPEAKKRTVDQEIEHAEKLIWDATYPDLHVLQYLSGGVDSDVQSALLSRAIEPERLHFRTLDTGTMRIGEIDEVREIADHLDLHDFAVLDTRDRFY
ncbi:MAG: gamma-glutamyl-gamma-aminobutyrate hydrolase family protein, partial [Candidatus Woesearchaeota archaeon]|nr:gamma-glutamyl-gamma-aminobutyrate hydrolase family protein [Candidatus Woesearchaeota archaeon]